MKKKSNKFMSFLFVISIALIMTACGKKTPVEGAGVPSTNNEEESQSGVSVNEPGDINIDDGADIPNPTQGDEDGSPTVAPTATPVDDQTTAQQDGMYTYNVDGVEITLHTNIDDYISERREDVWQVDLLGIAHSLGFEFPSRYVVECPLEEQTEFEPADGGDYHIYLENLRKANYYRIYQSGYMTAQVDFDRLDIDDDSVKTYWISNNGSGAPVYKVNYEQIVIMTMLMENYTYDPTTDWIEDSELPTAGGQSVFHINK